MRAAFLGRRDPAPGSGGDSMQAEEAASWLRGHGWEAWVAGRAEEVVPTDVDVVVLMSVLCCLDWGDLPERTRRAGARLVLWPLHHPTHRYDHEGRRGLPRLLSQTMGGGPGFVAAAQGRRVGVLVRRMTEVLAMADRVLLSWIEEGPALRADIGPLPACQHVVPVAVGPAAKLPGTAPTSTFPRGVVQVGRVEPLKQPLATLLAARDLGLPVTFVGAMPWRRHPGHSLRFVSALRRSGPGVARWLAPLPPSGVAAAIDAARVHVLPSWVEVAGRSTLEAAARGLPVVLSSEGHASAMLGGPARGVEVVDPADHEGLRRAIERAVAEGRDPERPAARRVREHYTWEQVGPLLEGALR